MCYSNLKKSWKNIESKVERKSAENRIPSAGRRNSKKNRLFEKLVSDRNHASEFLTNFSRVFGRNRFPTTFDGDCILFLVRATTVCRSFQRVLLLLPLSHLASKTGFSMKTSINVRDRFFRRHFHFWCKFVAVVASCWSSAFNSGIVTIRQRSFFFVPFVRPQRHFRLPLKLSTNRKICIGSESSISGFSGAKSLPRFTKNFSVVSSGKLPVSRTSSDPNPDLVSRAPYFPRIRIYPDPVPNIIFGSVHSLRATNGPSQDFQHFAASFSARLLLSRNVHAVGFVSLTTKKSDSLQAFPRTFMRCVLRTHFLQQLFSG